MTTEEFHGHLMAALHGPNADEIAARVLELSTQALRGDGSAKAGKAAAEFLVAAGLADAWSTLFDLQILAHLEGLSRRNPRESMRVILAKEGIRDDIRSALRRGLKQAGHSEFFEKFFLDPEDAEP